MSQTMVQHLIQQGAVLGEKRGETRTKRETLLKLLGARFEPVHEAITKRVTAIWSIARLDALFEQALSTQTLDDIDWENASK